MPNVLAHFAVQGTASHGLLRNVDPRWVLVGCVIPDVPWIIQRAGQSLFPAVGLYDLRLYAVVQASLLFCLVLAAAIAVVAARGRTVAITLAFGCLLHLLLDALQTKWANGVHLFAPLSWEMRNLGVFWPENPITYVLTAAGVVYFVWAARSTAWSRPIFAPLTVPRVALGLGLLGVYLVLPLHLLTEVEESDSHYVDTLQDRQARAGRYVEFDRNQLLRRGDEAFLRTFAGEELRLVGDDLGSPGAVSLRGVFLDTETVHVLAIHRHRAGLRDAASYLGLLGLVGLWSVAFARRARLRFASAARS